MKKYYFFILLLLIFTTTAYAQKSISGFVYEDAFRTPLPDVSVFTTSGNTSYTDSFGHFTIPVSGNKDSIYFRYKTRNSKIFPVDTIINPENFEIAIHLNILAKRKNPPGYLPDITVYSKDYRLDSIQNRRDYAAIFNYKKPSLEDIASVPKIGNIPIPVGVYFDVNTLAESFQFRKNKRKEHYRDFAVWLEQEKYIDYRFNKRAVANLTNLSGNDLDVFVKKYRPDFTTLLYMSDVELGVYIKKCLSHFSSKNAAPTFREKLKQGIFLEDNKS